MSRLGFLVREGHFDTGVESIAAACALPGLEAEGIFTHFAVSDEDDRDSEAYTRAQFDVSPVCWSIGCRGQNLCPSATAPTAALCRLPEMYLDMVRPGIALYGVGADAQRLDLRPVMSLKSSVSTIKTFDRARTSATVERSAPREGPGSGCCPSAMRTVSSGASPTGCRW